MKHGEAFVFCRPSGPVQFGVELGHVGWGFRLPDGRYSVGAVENPAGLPWNLPGKTGFWSETVVDAARVFSTGPLGRYAPYDLWKTMPVATPDVGAALDAIRAVALDPYVLFGKNCMDATHAVLKAYGADNLPRPSETQNYAPGTWFDNIASEASPLVVSEAPAEVLLYENPGYRGSRLRIVADDGIPVDPGPLRGVLADGASSLLVRTGLLIVRYADGVEAEYIAGAAVPYLRERGRRKIARLLVTP